MGPRGSDVASPEAEKGKRQKEKMASGSAARRTRGLFWNHLELALKSLLPDHLRNAEGVTGGSAPFLFLPHPAKKVSCPL